MRQEVLLCEVGQRDWFGRACGTKCRRDACVAISDVSLYLVIKGVVKRRAIRASFSLFIAIERFEEAHEPVVLRPLRDDVQARRPHHKFLYKYYEFGLNGSLLGTSSPARMFR